MLVKLLPDQIAKNWETISYAIEQALPPVAGESDEKMNNVLMALLDGRMDCWVSYKNGDDGMTMDAVVSTTMLDDGITGARNFLLYSIFTFDWADDNTWKEGFEALAKYAKSKGCSKIVGYTSFDSMIDRAKEMGAEAEFMFVSWQL